MRQRIDAKPNIKQSGIGFGLTVSVVVFGAVFAAGRGSASESTESLLQGYMSYWESLKQAEFSFTIFSTSQPAGSEALSPQPVKEGIWVRNGRQERVKRIETKSGVMEDFYTNGERLMTLRKSVDELCSDNQALTICEQCGYRARDYIYDGVELEENYKFPPLLRFVHFWSEPPRTIEQVLSSWNCDEPAKSSNGEGDVVWVVRAHHPGDMNREGSHVDIAINETKGYLIESLHYYDTGAKAGGEYVQTKYELDAEDIVLTSNGIPFYKVVRSNSYKPNSEELLYVTRVTFTELARENVTADRLGFNFPKGVLVDTRRPGDRNGRLYVASGDGGESRSFESAEVLENQRSSECEGTMGDMSPAPPGTTD